MDKNRKTDFYCERHQCHMTYQACARRRNLARAKSASASAHAPSAKDLMIAPELCIDCPQGKEVADLLAQQKANKIKQPPETGPNTTCLWPDCKKPAQASGLCNTHFKAARKNSLVKLNTYAASPDALKVFLEQLILIAQKNNMPVEDVAIACTHQGIQQYFRINPEHEKGGHSCTALSATEK